jgi:hypothetical protein
MDDHHNPVIEIIELGEPLDFTKEEVLIRRLHFIWLGSPLNYINAKNIPKWVTINQGCQYQIYIWYDSNMLDNDGIKLNLEYIQYLNDLSSNHIYLCDVRSYRLFYDDFIFNSYEYELGLQPRPGINPLASEIKNYGMATDVLRMCILKLYGGFYMDLDMTPNRLCDYMADKRIKSCPLRFCIALAAIPGEVDVTEEDKEAYDNIYNDYDNYYNYREKYDVDELGEGEYLYELGDFDNGMINNGLYYDPSVDHHRYIDLYFSRYKYNYARIMKHHYYPYFLDFRMITIYGSGPDIFAELFIKHNDDYPELSSYKSILRGIIEDPAQSTHSWITIAKHKDVLAVLIYELFKDDELIDLAYNFSLKGAEYYEDDENDIKVAHILYRYLLIFNNKAVFMYNNTPTYREELMDKLSNKILSDNPPSISLYIDLADLFINIPGPYLWYGMKGNYTKEEKELVDQQFKVYIEPFMIKYQLKN